MAKLFLVSQNITTPQVPAFMKLVGKNTPADVSIALIENAADTTPETGKTWMYENRDAIAEQGFMVDLVDLRDDNKSGVMERLSKADVIWVGGGNVFYLRWILKESGADAAILDLIGRGKVYAGGSAGAVVVGPTLQHFEDADPPEDAPELVPEGLNLTEVVVVPHWERGDYAVIMKTVEQNLRRSGYKTQPLTDQQALVIDGEEQTVIPLSG